MAHFQKSIDLLRGVEDWMYLPLALNYRGLGFLAISDLNQSRVDLEEAIEISRSTGAKLIEWEAHINYCLLEIEQDNVERVRQEYNCAHRLLSNSKYKMRDSDVQKIETYLQTTPELTN